MTYQPIENTDRIVDHPNGWPLEGLRLPDAIRHLRETCSRRVETIRSDVRYRIRQQYTLGHTLSDWREDHRRFAIVRLGSREN